MQQSAVNRYSVIASRRSFLASNVTIIGTVVLVILGFLGLVLNLAEKNKATPPGVERKVESPVQPAPIQKKRRSSKGKRQTRPIVRPRQTTEIVVKIRIEYVQSR